MDIIIEFFNWFWSVETDSLIIPFFKGNMIIGGVIWVLLKARAKRTKSPYDDELIADLERVLPMMKKR